MSDLVLIGLGVGIFWLLIGTWHFLWPRKKSSEGRFMSKQDRRKHVTKEVSDAVVTAIEDLVFKNRITRSEADKRYRMLADRCGLDDLVRPNSNSNNFHNLSLKERILLRRAHKIHKPVPLPDPNVRKAKSDPKAELAWHKKLLATLEQDAKLIEQGVSKLTRKERKSLAADNDNAVKKEN